MRSIPTTLNVEQQANETRIRADLQHFDTYKLSTERIPHRRHSDAQVRFNFKSGKQVDSKINVKC